MSNNNIHTIEKHTILAFLPYSESSQLINKQQKLGDLYLTETIVCFALAALETFLKGELIAFDAQVGENLCQIRAYKIIHLAKKWLYENNAKSELKILIENFKNYHIKLCSVIHEFEKLIQRSKSYNKILDGTESVLNFFNRNEISFLLNEDMIFIIKCRFLTVFSIRKNNMPLAMNLEHISSEFNISKYRAKRLVRRYQQVVCQIGCEFIYNLAGMLPKRSGYLEILPLLYKISDENRPVLPCYLASKIILAHALQEKTLILIGVKRLYEESQLPYDIVYFLLQKREHQEFSLIPCDTHLTQHCMVVSGEICNEKESSLDYIYRFLSEDPLKLILANTAIHPQYSGNKLAPFRDNPFLQLSSERNVYKTGKEEDELAGMRKFALQSGCLNQDPATFFLKHVYADTISNEINKLPPVYTGCAFNILEREKGTSSYMAGHGYDKQRSESFAST